MRISRAEIRRIKETLNNIFNSHGNGGGITWLQKITNTHNGARESFGKFIILLKYGYKEYTSQHMFNTFMFSVYILTCTHNYIWQTLIFTGVGFTA